MTSQANLCVSAVMVLVLSCRLVVAYEELKIAEKEIDDGMAEKSMNEMFEKLQKTVSSDSCQGDADPSPRPCIDLVSGQSVITQLCDRITSLEARLNRIASYSAPVADNPGNGDYTTHNSANQINDVEDVKTELKNLQRSSAFYAKTTDKIENATQSTIQKYVATLNQGSSFQPLSGIFEAPYEGIYHFTLTYQKTPDVDLETSLIVDDSTIASAKDEQQAHIDVLTSLKLGQQVWTEFMSNSIPVDPVEVTFTFSGYLIK